MYHQRLTRFYLAHSNSENTYFITEAQALGALAVKKYAIEPLPTAYIIVGEGTPLGSWVGPGESHSINPILQYDVFIAAHIWACALCIWRRVLVQLKMCHGNGGDGRKHYEGIIIVAV